VDSSRLLQQTHRFFAVEANNAAWAEIDPPGDAGRALELAWASLFHWREAGGPIHIARAHGTVSRAYLLAGKADLALEHASLYALAEGADDWEPWDAYFLLAARARAFGLLADPRTTEAKAAALALAEGLTGEDQAICLADWRSIP